MTKRILSICFALVLLFGVLAGCSKNEAQTADGRPGLVRFAINDDTHKVDYISVRLTR